MKAVRAAHFAPWMYLPIFSFIANVGGFFSSWISIYLLVTSLGWAYGLGVWAISCIISVTVVSSTINYIFPLMFILSMLSMAIASVLLAIT